MEHIQTIHPSEVENALAKIWTALQGTGKMRSCLFNLIVYAHQNDRIEYIDATIKKTIEKFPARIIKVILDKKCKKAPQTKVAALSTKNSPIFCDVIEISLHPDTINTVALRVLPFLLPDLPLYLLYSEDLEKTNPFFPHLKRYITRIIFDSELTNDLGQFAKIALKQYAPCDIADLNWGRISSWRELMASLFHNARELAHLKKTKQITLSYNARQTSYVSHTQTQAFFLQFFLATQLKWKLENHTKTRSSVTFHYKGNQKPITVTLTQDTHKQLRPGGILSMHITTTDDKEYQLTRDAKNPYLITVTKKNPQFCCLPSTFLLEKEESGQSLIKELCHNGTSLHFLTLLKKLQTNYT